MLCLAKGPQLAIDKDAAGRMIHHSLSSDQVYVKALNEAKEEEKTQEITPNKPKLLYEIQYSIP